jgi:hypothetical protein
MGIISELFTSNGKEHPSINLKLKCCVFKVMSISEVME